MAEETPSLQIDTDWKKQAQEEKRRLAEQQKQQASAPAAGIVAGDVAAAGGGMAGDARTARESGTERQGRGREMPPASFTTLVQSLVTQALFALGELAIRGSSPNVDLDAAKHHIDALGVLEEKTANNLTPEEKRMLDSALYETRMRYVSTASQYIS